jgi:hypothetical protein
MIPEVCRIERTSFQIYESFKDSSLGHTGRTLECETFFKFRRVKKGVGVGVGWCGVGVDGWVWGVCGVVWCGCGWV